MGELIFLIFLIFFIAILASLVALPIIALVVSIRNKNKLTRQISGLTADQISPHGANEERLSEAIRQLTVRVARLEVALGTRQHPGTISPEEEPPAATDITEPEPITPTEQPAPTPLIPTQARHIPTGPPSPPKTPLNAAQLESVIGRRWVGWAAIALILFAAAFFLKYAFENRWIGELGRVSIGVAAGLTMTLLGYRYHLRGWRVFSQILTAGGVVLLYLSAYAAFGYYHLVPQKAAFIFLIVLVAEAAGLALLYSAPAIAIMALIGGFLAPLLLHTDRDQYWSLFGYIIALDLGALALLKHWRGLSSLAFAGSHLLFWIWYGERYHPEKLDAVMVFHIAVFLMFLAAHVARQLLRRKQLTVEDLGLMLSNPFVFFATSYHFLSPYYHDWMGVFAIGMALLYAAAAKILLDRSAGSRNELLVMIGVALTFVTIAIPIQLKSNWITIAWAVEALVMLWVGMETKTKRLQLLAWMLFTLAIGKMVIWDTPYGNRRDFIPVFNRYFLSSLAVIGCVFGAAWLYQRIGERKPVFAPKLRIVAGLIGIITLWWVMSIETHTFFTARAAALKVWEDVSREQWLGQMALSVLWALYAAVLATIGFVKREPGIRWAALTLFAITVIKAMIIDIAYLEQIYRIIVFFVLGILLLLVAWGYHRAFYAREPAK